MTKAITNAITDTNTIKKTNGITSWNSSHVREHVWLCVLLSINVILVILALMSQAMTITNTNRNTNTVKEENDKYNDKVEIVTCQGACLTVCFAVN